MFPQVTVGFSVLDASMRLVDGSTRGEPKPEPESFNLYGEDRHGSAMAKARISWELAQQGAHTSLNSEARMISARQDPREPGGQASSLPQQQLAMHMEGYIWICQ